MLPFLKQRQYFVSRLRVAALQTNKSYTDYGPTIPKGRDKVKWGARKPLFGQHRQRKSFGWSPMKEQTSPRTARKKINPQ